MKIRVSNSLFRRGLVKVSKSFLWYSIKVEENMLDIYLFNFFFYDMYWKSLRGDGWYMIDILYRCIYIIWYYVLWKRRVMGFYIE